VIHVQSKLSCYADCPRRTLALPCPQRLFESITLVPNSICTSVFLTTFKNSATASTIRHLTYDCSWEDNITDLATFAIDVKRGQAPSPPGRYRWTEDLQRRFIQLKESQYPASSFRTYASESREPEDLTAVYQLLRNCRSINVNLGQRSKLVLARNLEIFSIELQCSSICCL
jgi:hypothetical protein